MVLTYGVLTGCGKGMPACRNRVISLKRNCELRSGPWFLKTSSIIFSSEANHICVLLPSLPGTDGFFPSSPGSGLMSVSGLLCFRLVLILHRDDPASSGQKTRARMFSPGEKQSGLWFNARPVKKAVGIPFLLPWRPSEYSPLRHPQ